jgi:hypothetical protein
MSEDKNIYYVYVHRKLSDNSIFYVGKGCNNRHKDSWGRNINWWKIVINEGGFQPCVLEENLDEESAYLKEMSLIKKLEELGITNISGNNDCCSCDLNIPETIKENLTIEITYQRIDKKPKVYEERQKIFEANKHLKNKDIVKLILEKEETARKTSVSQWVSNKKRGRIK